MTSLIMPNLTMEQYLSLDAVSRSQLCLLGTRSPAHLKAQLDGEAKKTTKALRLGSVIDTAVFEPGTLWDSIYLRPETCKTAKGCNVPWDLKTNDAQAWVAAHQDKPICTQTEVNAAVAIAASVRSHPSAALALERGKAQQTIVVPARDLLDSIPRSCDVRVKIRPDWLSGEAIVDLKSTVDASREEFVKSIYNYGYDVQAALYIDACNLLSLGKKHFVFLCVEKEPPYAVAAYSLGADSIEKGRLKYRYWLATYCECVRTGEWPGYSTQIEQIDLTEWAMRRAA